MITPAKLDAMVVPLLLAGLMMPAAFAYDSGSTGADGDLIVSVNTEVQLPPGGVLNYKSIRVDAGQRLTFRKNATNTPVVLLVQGDVTVNGTIDVSGASSTHTGTAGDGNIGDDGLPGAGGPGGYDGGMGSANPDRAGNGVGPGGGVGGSYIVNVCYCGGGGASYASVGAIDNYNRTPASAAYGSETLLPLIGGSGGGGGAGGASSRGSGGGGGGGAILIAAKGTVTIGQTGQILANGGASGMTNAPTAGTPGGSGGGGSGGAIRIVATSITGEGTVQAAGGQAGALANGSYRGGNGGTGRIRIEAESFVRSAATDPPYTFGAPGAIVLAGTPALRIARIAGVNVPTQPTGRADVLLPGALSNPVGVDFEATGVPAGSIVKLTITPPNAAPITADSTPLAGDTTLATATASVTLPAGPTVFLATVTYQVNIALGESLSRFASNERVDRVRLSAAVGGVGVATLITVSGKEYEVPLAALAAAGG